MRAGDDPPLRPAGALPPSHRAPNGGLLIENYDHLTGDQIAVRLDKLPPDQIRRIENYEQGHKNHKTLRHAFDRALKNE